MNCPHCNHPLTDEEARKIWASRNGKRQTPHGGRPKLPRCPCGAMTINRAAARGHKCETVAGK